MYEYRVENIYLDTSDIKEAIINELANDNWELICVDNGIAYFKRFKPTPEIDTQQMKEVLYG